MDVYIKIFLGTVLITKIRFKKSYLTTNIVMLVNLEPHFGFMLETKNVPNYQHEHIISAMILIWGIDWNKLGLNECELDVLILT